MSDRTRPTPRGITCHKCGSTRLRVLYTRPREAHVLRRRCCRDCGARITTWERAVGR